MGDKVYPGFAIYRMAKVLTVEDVQRIVVKRLGGKCWRLGMPFVEKIEEENNPTVTFVVSGCTLTYNQIRDQIFGYREGDFYVKMMDKDFGIPRTSTGAFTGGKIEKDLHEDLVRARQYHPTPLIFVRKDIVLTQLGGLDVLENTIIFDGGMSDINQSMLQKGCLVTNTSDGTKGGKLPGKGKNDRIAITYPYRFDALQQLCQLNQNRKFCPKMRSFIVKSRREGNEQERRCAILPRAGLGPNEEVVNAKYFMESLGYIPKEKLDPAFFDLPRLKTLVTECFMCESVYQVLGMDADFNWLAGRCACLASSDRNDWNNQLFIKLSLLPPQIRIANKFLDSKGNIKLFPCIDGITPQYNDANEFQATALQAMKISHTYDARQMLISGQCEGQVEKCTHVDDYVTESGTQYKVFCVKLVVKKNKFWNKDTAQAVAKANLIRMALTPWPKSLTPHQMKQNNIRGNLHSCVERTRYGKYECILTIAAYVPKKEAIVVGEKFVVVPKPHNSEINRAKKLTAAWKTYDEKREDCLPQLKGTVQSHSFLDHPRNTHRQKAVRIEFCLEDVDRVSKLCGLEKKVYFGCDVILKVFANGQRRLTKISLRIFSACEHPLSSERFQIVGVGFIHPDCQIRVGEVVEMDFWCVTRNQWEGMSTATTSAYALALPAGYREAERENDDDDEEEEEDWEEEDWDDDDNEDERNERPPSQTEETQQTEEESIPFLHWYILKDNDPREISLVFDPIERFVSEMIRRPAEPDFTNLDYLLYPTPYLQHKTEPLLTLPRSYDNNEDKVVRILSQLNPSQSEAVHKMVYTRLSIIQGPPGTGKTGTGSLGICLLHCLEEGLIVATASSNEATDVMFQRIKRDNEKLGIGMKVMRMYAASKEELSVNGEFDESILHHAMQMHPDWKKDKAMARLIDIKMTEGTAMIKEDEKKALRNHIRRIQMKILKKQDVVVCTVGAMADGRITMLQESFVKKGPGVLAVFVDEASLLTLPNTLGPLTLGSSRVVILGDFLQLPPVVEANSACMAGLHVSWMDLLNLIPYVKQEGNSGKRKVFTMLDTQYRMHENICSLVSTLTYQGKLKTADVVKTREVQQFTKSIEDFGSELVWINYDGYKDEKKIGTSYWNPREVDIVFDLLMKLKGMNVPLNLITVIGMYEAQVAKMKVKLDTMTDLEGVVIATVDSYQGKENGVVIVDLVRSNNESNVGFMREQKRLNVALSRAMFQLFVIGDMKVISGCSVPFWKKIVEFFTEKAVIKMLD